MLTFNTSPYESKLQSITEVAYNYTITIYRAKRLCELADSYHRYSEEMVSSKNHLTRYTLVKEILSNTTYDDWTCDLNVFGGLILMDGMVLPYELVESVKDISNMMKRIVIPNKTVNQNTESLFNRQAIYLQVVFTQTLQHPDWYTLIPFSRRRAIENSRQNIELMFEDIFMAVFPEYLPCTQLVVSEKSPEFTRISANSRGVLDKP